VYLQHLIKERNDRGYRIQITSCGGSQQVLARARALVDDQPGASIVTVFDADAAKLHREAQTLFRKHEFCRSFSYETGEIEDQVPIALHVAVLQACHGLLGTSISDFDLRKQIVPQIKRILWESKMTEFDKLSHANNIVANLNAGDHDLDTLMTIAQTTSDFAASARRRRLGRMPALDRLIREAMNDQLPLDRPPNSPQKPTSR
jgi:hypothetical protein